MSSQTNNRTNNRTNNMTKFTGKLPLPDNFRKHRELVAGADSVAGKISREVLGHFRITLFNTEKGPEERVPFRETNMIFLTANSESALRRGADLLKAAVISLITAKYITQTVSVDRAAVGHVIGRGGETVKGIAAKVGNGVRIQFEEGAGFVVTGHQKQHVDYAVSLVTKQAESFRPPTTFNAKGTSVECQIEGSFIRASFGDEKRTAEQAKRNARHELAKEINPTTGEKLYANAYAVPWSAIDAHILKQEKVHSIAIQKNVQKAHARQDAVNIASLARPDTFSSQVGNPVDISLAEKWILPTSDVFDPTARRAPPPPPPTPVAKMDTPVEISFDGGWEHDANLENELSGGDLFTNVTADALAEEQARQDMDDEYEEFMRDNHDDQADRDHEETHYSEHTNTMW
jgi:hypothetical protein